MLLPRLFRLLDSALGWIERSERGRQVIALVLTITWAVWAFVERIPAPVLVALAAILFAAGLVLQDYGARWLRIRLGPPIEVHIDGMSVNFQEPDESSKEFALKLGRQLPLQPATIITAPLYILNRSRKRRVSLKIISFIIDRKPPRIGVSISAGSRRNPWFELDDGMRLNLGPEEDTEGFITIPLGEGTSWVKGEHEKMLVFRENISGRIARVKIPGRFPPRRS